MSLTVEYDVLAEEPVPVVVESLQSLFETYGWWADRDAAAVRAAVEETDEVVFVREQSDPQDERAEQPVVAAARILTDYVYYAQVYDVIVRADRRGDGVGRTLVEGIADHPALSDVAPSLLAREGLVEFYEACGFEDPGDIAHPDGDPEPLTWLVARDDDDAETTGSA